MFSWLCIKSFLVIFFLIVIFFNLKHSQQYQFSLAAEKCHRSPGDRWMIFGPVEYIPPIEVTVKSRRFDLLSSCEQFRTCRMERCFFFHFCFPVKLMFVFIN